MINVCPEFSKEIAQLMKNEKHIFLVGLGLAECVAKEGSLKMKELTYKHCQAYSLNNVSNGFFSFSKQNKGTFTYFIILDDEFKDVSLRYMKYMHDKLKVNIIVISDI